MQNAKQRCLGAEGSLIGADPSGMVGRANTFEGVRLRTIGNIVGGKAPAARNILAGNGRASVRDEAR